MSDERSDIAAAPDVGIDSRRVASLRRSAPALAGVVVAVTLVVLGCWAFGGAAAQARWPAVFVMKANTAIGLLLLAAALLARASRPIVLACAAAVACLTLLTFAEYVAGVDLRIDRLFAADHTAARFPGRPSPGTSACHLLLAIAVAASTSPRRAMFAHGLVLAASSIPLAALGGYIYRAPGLSATTPVPIPAVQTAISQSLLSAAFLFADAPAGATRVVVSRSNAGAIARKLLPLGLLVPFACGLAVDVGERAGWYGVQFGASLLVTACALLFAGAVWFTTSLMASTERTRTVESERRVAAEAKLGDREAWLRIAIETANLGSWERDLKTGTFDCSPQFLANFGVPEGESFGVDAIYEAIDPDDRDRVRAAVRRAIEGRGDYREEYRVRWPGTTASRWIVASGRCVYGPDGEPLRMVGVTLDVTERKRIEAGREAVIALERTARVDAERASHMKDEFLATLSHELRTPLNAILGWSQILARNAGSSGDVAQGLEVIGRNARAQGQIIEDLLDMSRIISGKVRLDVARVGLADLVDAAVESIRPTADARGVRVHSVVDPLHGVLVSGDAGRLQQVLWNLLSNAVKFTPRGGRVHVVLGRVRSHLELRVSDTGEGITADFLPYVFDRFRQADGSSTRRHGGLGLGLSIVKQLVELHGGTVSVASDGPGQGATFVVSLPVMAVHAVTGPALVRHAPGEDGPSLTGMAWSTVRGVRVLVVDDEQDARELVRRLLESCDAVVAVASSAEEALARLSTASYDVLVSDIGMPGEDGHQLIRRIRSLPREGGGAIPAIALTAYARAEDRVKAIASGFQMHVSKPVEAVELMTMVAGAAGRLHSN